MRFRISVPIACGLLMAALATSSNAQLPALLGNSDGKPTLAPLLKQVTPAVVSIFIEGHAEVGGQSLGDPFLDRFFGFQNGPQVVPQQGAGSGVIIDARNGYVLTNHHVVDSADKVTVILSDGRRFEAKVIGSDEGTDVALLKIDADNLTALTLADSDSLEVGDFVLAIGNPFGLGQTVTSGIVSALGRGGINADGYEDFIQTDASINPGNSGGALVDLDGQLVGINSAIIAPSGGNVGIGFAVPSNMAQAVVDQLLEYGEVRRGMLGVTISDLEPDLATGLGLDVQQGAVVGEVVKDSPAEHAGLEPGDVIVEFDGHPVTGSSDLRNKVGLVRAGSTVRVGFIRDGKRQTVSATIGDSSNAPSLSSVAPGKTIDKLDGAEFRTLDPKDPASHGMQGVLIARVNPNSRAASYGLMEGDVITGVNNRYPVHSVDDLTSIVSQARGTFALNVVRDGRQLFLVIR
jgi:serine protease DegQ